MPKIIFPVFIVVMVLGFAKVYSPKPEPKVIETVITPAQDSLARFLVDFEQSLVEGANANNLPGGAFVITYKDEILVAKGFGTREVGIPLPIDEHTAFRLGSVSKGFASVLAGMMVDQGVLTFDDTVSSILPYFNLMDSNQTDRIQVHHLLSHTTGLPRHAYTNLVEDGLSLERIIPRFVNVPLIDREGEQHAYTNAAYSVIEKVLEQRTNSDFKQLLDEEIFAPLGMEYASSSYRDFVDNTNIAHPHLYRRSSRSRVSVPIKDNYFNAASSGGINASVSDMGSWLLLLTGNRPDLISEETLDQVFEPISRIPNKRFSRYWPGVNDSYYAMGWRVLHNGDQTITYHGGYVNGYRSEIAFDRESQIGICILFNSNSSYALRVIPGFFNDFAPIDSLFDSYSIESVPASDE